MAGNQSDLIMNLLLPKLEILLGSLTHKHELSYPSQSPKCEITRMEHTPPKLESILGSTNMNFNFEILT